MENCSEKFSRCLLNVARPLSAWSTQLQKSNFIEINKTYLSSFFKITNRYEWVREKWSVFKNFFIKIHTWAFWITGILKNVTRKLSQFFKKNYISKLTQNRDMKQICEIKDLLDLIWANSQCWRKILMKLVITWCV